MQQVYQKGIAIHPQTGLISGILPIGSSGNYNVLVKVSDGIASSQQSFSWNVNSAQLIANFSENFNSNNGGFSYRDGMFKFADLYGNFYARGYRTTSGHLVTKLGGRDDLIINDMSGGWERTIDLSQASIVTLDLKYRLEFKGGYESDENSQLFVAINGRKRWTKWQRLYRSSYRNRHCSRYRWKQGLRYWLEKP